MEAKPVLWIEGIIGAGKSTLATQLADILKFRPIFEPVESNPYLEKFYQDPKTWAFTMQLHLLAHRYGLQKLAVGESLAGDRYKGVILDRGLPGDRVFCRMHMLAGNIHELQWKTYDMFYNTMTCDLRPPSLILFLDVDPQVAMGRIGQRGRTAESGMTLDYLTSLRAGYMDLLSEIESGDHAWSRGMRVLRWPWNTPHQPLEPLVQRLKQELKM